MQMTFCRYSLTGWRQAIGCRALFMACEYWAVCFSTLGSFA
jgi:hypothetical protein